MVRPPTDQLRRFLVALFTALIVYVTAVTGQQPSVPQTNFPLYIEVLLPMVFTAAACVALVGVVPTFTRDSVDPIHSEPLLTLWYGFAASVVVIIVSVVFLITVVGALVALPLILIVAVYAHLGYLAVARQFTDSWTLTVAIAVLLSGILAVIPIVGMLVGTLLSLLGVGATTRHIL